VGDGGDGDIGGQEGGGDAGAAEHAEVSQVDDAVAMAADAAVGPQTMAGSLVKRILGRWLIWKKSPTPVPSMALAARNASGSALSSSKTLTAR
jgi:hypothetical protein